LNSNEKDLLSGQHDDRLPAGQDLFEGELHEAVERRSVPLDTGSEQRPFVRVEKKGRDIRGLMIG
jgi:hypothetical protein